MSTTSGIGAMDPVARGFVSLPFVGPIGVARRTERVLGAAAAMVEEAQPS